MTEQLKTPFTIERMQPEDLEAATAMRLQSWLDTYPNEEAGVTREWVEARNEKQRLPEAMERRRRQMEEFGAGWVAKVDGETVGMTTPYKDQYGIQHVGSLYVAKEQHGTGIGSALMQKILEWSDPAQPLVLSVASYNERAKAFYQKWGFKEVAGSESLFADVVPEIDMVRPGDNQEYPNLSPRLEVKHSPIDGIGIFAKAPINKGNVVLSWSPKLLIKEEADQLPDSERAHYTYPEGESILWMQPPERFVNHSCEPNTHVVGRSDVATCDIEPGEEVTSDYIDLETENFECHCGSKNCRGVVKGEVG